MNEPSSTDSAPTADLLTQHAGWMRSLARRLVRDEAQADDIVQTAMVQALERPPRPGRSLAGWLRVVVRNLAMEGHRERGHRSAREAAASEERDPSPTDELVARFETGQRLASALMTLEEPYRGALLLRYYEELPPREIARRRGVPVATVKSWLARGLAKLREQLDGAYGDRRSWAIALIPLTVPPAGAGWAPTSAPEAASMATSIKLALAAGLAAIVGSIWLLQDAAPPGTNAAVEIADAEDVARIERPQDAISPPAPGLVLEQARDARRASPTPEVANLPTPSSEPRTIEGRVIDANGAPLAGLEVRVRDGELGGDTDRARTEQAGFFRLQTTRERGLIESADPGWATVRAGSIAPSGSIDPVVVVAPSVTLAGRVIDEWGRALAGAKLSLVLPESFETILGAVLDASTREQHRAVSAEDGSFELAELPGLAQAELRAVHPGYEPVSLPAPTVSNPDLVIELRRPRISAEHALRGRVVFANGAPAPNAWVSSGLATVRADAEGWFALDLRREVAPETLRAVLAGFQPAVLDRETASGGLGSWPDHVVLPLGPPALTITGIVLGPDGLPAADARVWVGDATTLGVLGTVELRQEALAAGAPIPDLAVESLADLPDEDGDGSFGSARPQLEPDGLLAWVVTDGDGRFELGGLSDRAYRLNVLDGDLRFGFFEADVPAGARGVELAAPASEVLSLRGRVVDQAGEPVADVTITPWLPAVSTSYRVFGGAAHTTRWFQSWTVTTDAAGHFDLGQVPREYLNLHLVSDAILPAYSSVEEARDPEDFVIEVIVRAHLDIQVAPGADGADTFTVHDLAGRRLQVYEMRADGYSNYDEFPLDGGRSGVVTIPANTRRVRLYSGGELVEEVPVKATPGEITTIRR